MDVVKSNIEKIGGTVDIFSRPGEGATVKLKIPLTLAIIPGLVITSGGERFVIPQVSLLELIVWTGCRREAHRTRAWHARLPPARELVAHRLPESGAWVEEPERTEVTAWWSFRPKTGSSGCRGRHQRYQEIVVKPLASIEGTDGLRRRHHHGRCRVALILDVLGIGQRSGVLAESREQSRVATAKKTQSGIERQRLLLFRAGSFERLAVPLSLVARLEEFPQSSIEHAAEPGGAVRNRILPLVSLRDVLEPGAPNTEETADPCR